MGLLAALGGQFDGQGRRDECGLLRAVEAGGSHSYGVLLEIHGRSQYHGSCVPGCGRCIPYQVCTNDFGEFSLGWLEILLAEKGTRIRERMSTK